MTRYEQQEETSRQTGKRGVERASGGNNQTGRRRRSSSAQGSTGDYHLVNKIAFASFLPRSDTTIISLTDRIGRRNESCEEKQKS